MIKGYDFPRNVWNSDADFTEEDVQMHHSVRGAMFSSDPKVVDGVGGTEMGQQTRPALLLLAPGHLSRALSKCWLLALYELSFRGTQTNFKNQPPAGCIQCSSPSAIKSLPSIFSRYSFPSPTVGRAACALGLLIPPSFLPPADGGFSPPLLDPVLSDVGTHQHVQWLTQFSYPS